jgi:3-dehydroquinate dehydratase-1
MERPGLSLRKSPPLVVGSFGGARDLAAARAAGVAAECDLMEIRLDLLAAEMVPPDASLWAHLPGLPLLLTARRKDEGGAMDWTDAERNGILEKFLPDASLVDVELASVRSMRGLLEMLAERGIPWVASYHDFNRLPDRSALNRAAELACESGAAVFKAAARLESPADIARLAEFQLADHGIPVATMGMGPLAPVSRLLCAQCGSVLNYGYLGASPTAPGQWDCGSLKSAIGRLTPFAREAPPHGTT